MKQQARIAIPLGVILVAAVAPSGDAALPIPVEVAVGACAESEGCGIPAIVLQCESCDDENPAMECFDSVIGPQAMVLDCKEIIEDIPCGFIESLCNICPDGCGVISCNPWSPTGETGPGALEGYATVSVAGFVQSDCFEDRATPYLPAGFALGDVGNPLSLVEDKADCEKSGANYNWVVKATASLSDAAFDGESPYSLMGASATFDLPDASEPFRIDGSATTPEGCYAEIDLARVEIYAKAQAWAEEILTKDPDKLWPVNGTLWYLDSPTGPMLEFEGEGTGTIAIEFYAGDAFFGLATQNWKFEAEWTAVQQCGGSICGAAVVQMVGESLLS